MSDQDLTRLFAEQPDIAADDAFVAGVSAAIARRKRNRWLALAGVTTLLLFAVWITWPAAVAIGAAASADIALIGDLSAAWLTSDVGAITAAALLATAAFTVWLTNRVRG